MILTVDKEKVLFWVTTLLLYMVFPVGGMLFVLFYLLVCHHTIERSYAFPMGLTMGILGYSITPSGETDLTRYYDQVILMQGQSLKSIIAHDKERLVIKDIIFYTIAQTGNERLLGFFVGFVVYTICFYVAIDSCKRYNIIDIPNGYLYIFIILFTVISITPPFSVIGNVRNILAFSIIGLGFYREYVQKKKNIFTLFCYILPVGIHTSAITLIIIRILLPLIKKIVWLVIPFVILIPQIASHIYVVYLNGKTSNNAILQIIINAFSSINYYLISYKEKSSIYNTVNRIFALYLSISILLIILASYRSTNKDQIDNNIKTFYSLISGITISLLLLSGGGYWRYESILSLFFSVIMCPILAIKYKDARKALLELIVLFSIIPFLFNMYYFYRANIMREFLYLFFSTNILDIFRILF